MPYEYSGSHRNIKRMFRTELRNLQSPVAQINNRLLDTINLITEYHSITPFPLNDKIVQHYTPLGLFRRINRIPLAFQQTHNIRCLFRINPIDAVFSTQCSLMDFRIRRNGSNTAQIYPLNPESIRTSEYRTDIVQTPHIIQNNDQRNLVGSLKLAARQTVHFKN